MSEQMKAYREHWEDYEAVLERLATDIIAAAPDDGNLNGREWCEENGVPERMFAHAVTHAHDRLDYGVTPMRPWVMQ